MSDEQAEGIIYPPPDLRGIVDSTAKFVAKNSAFEERIKREHGSKPKFSFLFAGDPFNAYYQFKVNEIKNSLLASLDCSSKNEAQQQDESNANKDASAHEPREPNNMAPNDQQQTLNDNGGHSNEQEESNRHRTNQNSDDQSTCYQQQDQEEQQQLQDHDESTPRVKLKLDEYIQEMTMKLEEPPSLNFLATPAPNLTNMDCDIIKLTAQFIATHGRNFLLELVSREQNNVQFDFLKPQHGQFNYMTNLIMQYALIKNQPLDIVEQITKDATSQKHNIKKMKLRSEWNKMLELEKRKREEAEEKEKLLYSQIDWHDFVIVETIDYKPNERGEYPPTTADQVGTRLLLQQRLEEQNVPEEMEIDMDVESDDGCDGLDL